MGRLSLIFSTALGVGYLPWAPGSFGTLWGFLLFYLLGAVAAFNSLTMGLVTLALSAFAVLTCHFSEKQLGTHDASILVIDEVVGYLVAVWGFSYSFKTAALAYVLFRFFDILKPWPVGLVDKKVGGGLGVVLDDVVAGILANVVLRLGIFLWGKIF
ncbi:MAG: phosphatidylglycerophosphatase A [Deltaproteobacteria bacterium]|nr:phosphatidylglycerophosphatase A [Deltaproteobacteria bacterium]